MPPIIEEAKKDMVVNLIVRFHEWQHKRLNEAIEIESSSNKQRIAEKGLFFKLASNISLMLIRPSLTALKV